jgi:hypothetical protein
LLQTIPGIGETLDKIREQLGGFRKDNHPVKVGGDRRSELPLATINDFILYLHDTTQTLISILHILPSLSQYFFKDGFVQRIAGFYEETMAKFDESYRGLKTEQIFLSKVKFGLIKICRFLIDAHCLVPLMNG